MANVDLQETEKITVWKGSKLRMSLRSLFVVCDSQLSIDCCLVLEKGQWWERYLQQAF